MGQEAKHHLAESPASGSFTGCSQGVCQGYSHLNSCWGRERLPRAFTTLLAEFSSPLSSCHVALRLGQLAAWQLASIRAGQEEAAGLRRTEASPFTRSLVWEAPPYRSLPCSTSWKQGTRSSPHLGQDYTKCGHQEAGCLEAILEAASSGTLSFPVSY